jgi:hypothetical protein
MYGKYWEQNGKLERNIRKRSDVSFLYSLIWSMRKYQVIYADPPRWYNSKKTGGERNDKTKFG